MSHKESKSAYFRQELEEGRTPSDPFEDATEEASKTEWTEEQKAQARLFWNNRIANMFGGEEKLRAKMLQRRARRAFRR